MIAEAVQSLPIESVVALIVGILGAGGGFALGRKTKTEVMNDPLSVKRADEYVRREDFEKFEKDIKEDIRIFKDRSWHDTNKIYERVNEMSENLAALVGEFRAFTNHQNSHEKQIKNNHFKGAR